MRTDYISRVIDRLLADRMHTFGVVLLSGPKWYEKTTMAKNVGQHYIELSDPEIIS